MTKLGNTDYDRMEEMMTAAMQSYLETGEGILLMGLIVELNTEGLTEATWTQMRQWANEMTEGEILAALEGEFKPYVTGTWNGDIFTYEVNRDAVLKMKKWNVETMGYRDEEPTESQRLERLNSRKTR